jgi:hypothetical protein
VVSVGLEHAIEVWTETLNYYRAYIEWVDAKAEA